MERVNAYIRALTIVCGVVSTNLTAVAADPDAAAYEAAVQFAVKDRVAADLPKHLHAIAPPYAHVETREQNGRTEVLCVSWLVGDKIGHLQVENERTLWVTVARDLKDFCRLVAANDAQPERRLEQVLGLPPKFKRTHFVEVWIDPKLLRRPCPDPEIDDTVAEAEFRPEFLQTDAGARHKKWYDGMKKECYEEAQKFPWTRGGYTYDWGSPSHVGLSEFVVVGPAKLPIERSKPTPEYIAFALER